MEHAPHRHTHTKGNETCIIDTNEIFSILNIWTMLWTTDLTLPLTMYINDSLFTSLIFFFQWYWWISAGDSSMSLRHYVTYKEESLLVGYIACEDVVAGDL